ncbi:hypothetical protein DOTSEDRAFT_26845 [Dothistroma septosporum NZE10]|uniref:Uncharacterized protein n=1 Tax=Dothistroma septosporum (strain NZE10 / CBS 128990) TaxID=675120 RepID=N1PGJ3_DOTSN|nr:hypothetical protein DOTSEDRAFT_26845 [Dothistroma septosporum NZE10]
MNEPSITQILQLFKRSKSQNDMKTKRKSLGKAPPLKRIRTIPKPPNGEAWIQARQCQSDVACVQWPGSRDGKTPEIDTAEEPPTEADLGAAERISNVWTLIATAARLLAFDREHAGVGMALIQLGGVLYETLADYDSTSSIRRERERHYGAPESVEDEATAGRSEERFGWRHEAQDALDDAEGYSVNDDGSLPGLEHYEYGYDEYPTDEESRKLEESHPPPHSSRPPQENQYHQACEDFTEAMATRRSRDDRIEPEALRGCCESDFDDLR